jgi:predicted nucleic acid-binding protein
MDAGGVGLMSDLPAENVVLDTNILSYMMEESPRGQRYRDLLDEYTGCIACLTPEELYFGASKGKWGPRRSSELERLIAEQVLLPVSLDIARTSGLLRASRERIGRRLECADAWIAATAMCNDMHLVTHDQDFHDIEGLKLFTLSGWRVEKPPSNFSSTCFF